MHFENDNEKKNLKKVDLALFKLQSILTQSIYGQRQSGQFKCSGPLFSLRFLFLETSTSTSSNFSNTCRREGVPPGEPVTFWRENDIAALISLRVSVITE